MLARVRRRWTSSARGTLTTASVEALVGTAQITATVAPNGRSSTSAPAAPLSDSESPSLASIFIPATGAAPLAACRRGSTGTAISATGSSASAP